MADPFQLGRVEIVPSDPAWRDAYRAEAKELQRLAGGLLVRMEHVGSTAIPDLPSKPTIDIMASTLSLEELDGLVLVLAERGYQELNGLFSFRRFFRRVADNGRLSYHLHIVQENVWQDKNERLFRDWLLNHPVVAKEYGRLKETLAERFGQDREGYTEAKTDFIRRIVNQARRSRGLEPLADWTE